MKSDLRYIGVAEVLADLVDKPEERRGLLRFLFGDIDVIDVLMYKIIDLFHSRTFMNDDGDMPTLLYFESPEQGRTIAAIMYLLEENPPSTEIANLFDKYYHGIDTSALRIYSNGPWCFWQENQWIFFDNIKDAIGTWIASQEFSTLSKGRKALDRLLKIKKVDIKLLESKAKQIASTNKEPVGSVSELIEKSRE